jgi:hypothetical protein
VKRFRSFHHYLLNQTEGTMGINIHGIDAPVLADFADDQHPAAKPKITPRAADGSDNGWPSGDDSAANGMDGLVGDQGFTGQDGLNGGNTPPSINIHITTFIDGFFNVTVRGGNGARGQKGGIGGGGGEGQDGGNGDGDVAAGFGGTGGRGGVGGTGGMGGNGGNASNINLYIENPNDIDLNNVNVEFSQGFKGGKGPGGRGGPGGLGGTRGEVGARSTSGAEGPEGVPGSNAGIDGTAGSLDIWV